MNARKKNGILAGGICLALVLIALAVILLPKIQNGSEATGDPTTTTPITTTPEVTTTPELIDAAAMFDTAKEASLQAQNWLLTYVTSQKRVVNKAAYTQTVSGTAAYSAVGTEAMLARIEESRAYGQYSNDYTEVYCQGAAYAEMADLAFRKEMDAQAFMQRQVPAVLLDSSLYGSITGWREEEQVTVLFSQPAALENWMAPEGAVLITASGTATLDSRGNLLTSSYSAEYSLGDVVYTYSAQVAFSATQESPEAHIHYETYQNVEDLDVLKSLLQVAGELFGTFNIRSQAVETIDCQQIPLIYSQESSYLLQQTARTFSASADYISSVTDYREQATVRIRSDSFIDGVFTSTVDGGEPVTDPEITQQKMRQTVEDAILSAMMAPNYLSSAVRVENDDSYTIQMTGNDAFCEDLMAVITAFLQVDLDALASSYETTLAGGYLTIDKNTQLPTSMGIHFQRVHTTAAGDYTLTYSMEHTLQFSE